MEELTGLLRVYSMPHSAGHNRHAHQSVLGETAIAECAGLSVCAERRERRSMPKNPPMAVITDVFDIVSRFRAQPPIVMGRFSEFPPPEDDIRKVDLHRLYVHILIRGD